MTLHIFWTMTLLLIFLGIVVWAWSGRRQQDFTEAANLPLEDDHEWHGSTQSVTPNKRG